MFRFSCAPVSRMECMLCLPSLDLVFSSKRSDSEMEEYKFAHQPGARGFSFDGVGAANKTDAAGDGGPHHSSGNYVYGGLSVTGCLRYCTIFGL